MNKKHWVMDYETLYNCFIGVFESYKTKETKIFVVHDLRNDFNDFITFIEKCITEKEWHISYNGLAFDAQITHHILDNYHLWKNLTGCEIANIIYNVPVPKYLFYQNYENNLSYLIIRHQYHQLLFF